MGQASRRGDLATRVQQALDRKQAIRNLADENRMLRLKQEIDAWETMTWWQVDMTERRYERIQKKKLDSNMAMATLLGIFGSSIYGGYLNARHQRNT
jgi:hypothetical protein